MHTTFCIVGLGAPSSDGGEQSRQQSPSLKQSQSSDTYGYQSGLAQNYEESRASPRAGTTAYQVASLIAITQSITRTPLIVLNIIAILLLLIFG